MKAENGIEDDPIYPQQPGTVAVGSNEELPTTAIEDMEVPPQPPRPEKTDGAPKRYSGNSYGSSVFMSAAGDDRSLRRKRMDSAVHSKESVGFGIVGVFLGTLFAMIMWAALTWAGYQTWLGALMIVAGAYFGYLMFARDIGAAGVIIILLFTAAGVYFGNRLCFAVSIYNLPGYSGTAFKTLTEKLVSVIDIFKNESRLLGRYGMKNSYQNGLIMGGGADVFAVAILFIRRFR